MYIIPSLPIILSRKRKYDKITKIVKRQFVWGCKITGWKSVNIYTVTSIVGEEETPQQKRIKYTINHNEEALG